MSVKSVKDQRCWHDYCVRERDGFSNLAMGRFGPWLKAPQVPKPSEKCAAQMETCLGRYLKTIRDSAVRLSSCYLSKAVETEKNLSQSGL